LTSEQNAEKKIILSIPRKGSRERENRGKGVPYQEINNLTYQNCRVFGERKIRREGGRQVDKRMKVTVWAEELEKSPGKPGNKGSGKGGSKLEASHCWKINTKSRKSTWGVGVGTGR